MPHPWRFWSIVEQHDDVQRADDLGKDSNTPSPVSRHVEAGNCVSVTTWEFRNSLSGTRTSEDTGQDTTGKDVAVVQGREGRPQTRVSNLL